MPLMKGAYKALLVVYHSINKYREERIRVPNIVTPTTFEYQIQSFASTARIISLQEYLDHVKEGKPLQENSIVLTFDDGYKDNLTIAAPILQKYGIPATFFITTGYIGTGRMKWEDQLSCLIRRSKKEVISIKLSTHEIFFKVGSEKEKLKVIDALVNILSHLSQTDKLHILNEIRIQSQVNCDDQADIMLSWEDVRELAGTPGFSIGSHAVTHRHLSQTQAHDIIFEVASSKEHLEKEISYPVTLFAYPYGDYNHTAITALQQSGYSCAVTLEYGQNSITSDPFRLKRVQAPNQIGTRFQIGMRLRSSIVGEFLRNIYNFTASSRRALPAERFGFRQ